MNRSHLARGALAALLLLTGLTGWASEAGAPVPLAVLSFVKAAIIGVVFLELDHARRGYAALAVLVLIAVLGGAVWAIGG